MGSEVKLERLGAGAIALAVPLAAAVIFFIPPGKGSIYPPCALHALTGFYCPTCGGTRALYYLMHGRWFASLAYNPLVLLFAIPAGFVYANLTRYALAGRLWNLPRLKIVHLWLLLALLILFGVLRNIPLYPFTLLAPPR